MTAEKIVRSAIKERNTTQTILAEEARLKRQTNIAGMLRSKSMKVDNFVRLLKAMNYDVVVVDHLSGEKKWVVEEPKEEE